MNTTWTRWFAWHRVDLQSGGTARFCFVEYERIKIDVCGWMLGSPITVTKYRMPAVLKGHDRSALNCLNN